MDKHIGSNVFKYSPFNLSGLLPKSNSNICLSSAFILSYIFNVSSDLLP